MDRRRHYGPGWFVDVLGVGIERNGFLVFLRHNSLCNRRDCTPVIGAKSRNARWLHLRIQQPPGERPQRIAISFPFQSGSRPGSYARSAPKLPGMENVPADIDQMLVAMGEATSPDNPFILRSTMTTMATKLKFTSGREEYRVMATSEERLRILKMVEEGKITAEEGAKLAGRFER